MRASLPFCNGANGKAGYRNCQFLKRLHMAKALKLLAPFVLEKPLRSAALPGIFGWLRIPKRRALFDAGYAYAPRFAAC